MSNASSTVALTQELIRRPSVSPEDQGCLQIIAERLGAIGFRLERMPFGPVENLWALHGEGGPVLCFAGHTDVVPTGPREEWHTDPFEPVVRDGMLYGRGAADIPGDELVLSGVGTVEACQRLGIGRKTRYRWRAENGGLPPTALSEGVRSQRHLSLLERQRIAPAP